MKPKIIVRLDTNNQDEINKFANKFHQASSVVISKDDAIKIYVVNEKGGTLHAHHIIPFSISKDNSLKNLITLCPSCHIKEHWRMKNEN